MLTEYQKNDMTPEIPQQGWREGEIKGKEKDSGLGSVGC